MLEATGNGIKDETKTMTAVYMPETQILPTEAEASIATETEKVIGHLATKAIAGVEVVNARAHPTSVDLQIAKL